MRYDAQFSASGAALSTCFSGSGSGSDCALSCASPPLACSLLADLASECDLEREREKDLRFEPLSLSLLREPADAERERYFLR